MAVNKIISDVFIPEAADTEREIEREKERKRERKREKERDE